MALEVLVTAAAAADDDDDDDDDDDAVVLILINALTNTSLADCTIRELLKSVMWIGWR